jgi:signal transduction histidine kinase/ActR/RegA family two-component response regulator
MATILIADDRPHNREFLTSLLGGFNHRVIECSNGAEAFANAQKERPDLVISDVLMPVMDGYELARVMRTEAGLADVPIVFWTAHYMEREARTLALKSGAVDILLKPCEPQEVLRIVDSVLASPPENVAIPPADFHRDHLRLLTDKLSKKTDAEYWARLRLEALLEAIHQLSLERNPAKLVELACREAREMIGAASAIIGILPGGETSPDECCIQGAELQMDLEFCRKLRDTELIRTLVREQRAVRCSYAQLVRNQIAWTETNYRIESVLAVPIVSKPKVYGWFCFINKIAEDAFSEQDEKLGMAFAGEVALAYESTTLYARVLELNAERQRHANELTKLHAELCQYTSVALHHLHESLGPVHRFAQLLQDRCGPALGEDGREYIAHVQAGVRRMKSLVTDLAEYARLAQSESPAHEVVSLQHAAQRAVDACADLIRRTNAQVFIDRLPLVKASRSQMQQVFDHLLTNAIKFCAPGEPSVRIWCEDRTDHHVIAVQDNGPGIPQEDRERIFNIFERLQGSETTGTGIGLALCQKIVEKHGGYLWVKPAPERGSIFYFTMPVSVQTDSAGKS